MPICYNQYSQIETACQEKSLTNKTNRVYLLLYCTKEQEMENKINGLLNVKEAAKFLGMSVKFLNRDRYNENLIPYVRIGRSAIRYKIEDMEAYIEKQSRNK